MLKLNVQKKGSLVGHKDCLYTLSPDQNPRYFYSSGGDGMVVRWDLAQPEIGDLIIKVDNSVYALATIPQRNQMLVGHNYDGVHLIDLEQKKEITSVKLTDAAIFDLAIWENTILVAGGDGVVIVLDYPSLAVRKHLKASDKSARSISINPIERAFAVGYSDHHIRVFGLKDLDLHHHIPAHTNSVFTVCYSPDGKYLLSGSRDAHLKSWSVEQQYGLAESVVAHMYAINHITFDQSGRYFASCSMDKSIKVWDYAQFKLLKVIDKGRHAGHGTSVNKLFWSPFENLLVSASDDRQVAVWDLEFYEA
ncbi:MAG: WD40 repeat domain-containing protein [Bacteroidota bacterium]